MTFFELFQLSKIPKETLHVCAMELLSQGHSFNGCLDGAEDGKVLWTVADSGGVERDRRSLQSGQLSIS